MSKAHIKSRLVTNSSNSITKDCIFYLAPTDENFIDYFGNEPIEKYGIFTRQNEFGYGVEIPKATTNLTPDPFFKTTANYTVYTFTNMKLLNNKYNPISKVNGALYLYKQSGASGFAYSSSININQTKHSVTVILKMLKGDINNVTIGGTIWYTDSTYTDYTWTNSHTTRKKYVCEEENVYILTATIEPNTSKAISYYQQRIAYTGTAECELIVYAVQVEQNDVPTTICEGARNSSACLRYNIPHEFNPNNFTITFNFTWLGLNTGYPTQLLSPKLLQIGNYYSNSSLSVWKITSDFRVYTKGISSKSWTFNSGKGMQFENGKTYFCAVVVDNLNIKLFLDDQIIASGTMSEPLGTMSGNIIYIGGDGNGTTGEGDKASSILSNIAIYKRYLSDLEIQQIANNKSFYSNMIKAGVAL